MAAARIGGGQPSRGLRNRFTGKVPAAALLRFDVTVPRCVLQLDTGTHWKLSPASAEIGIHFEHVRDLFKPHARELIGEIYWVKMRRDPEQTTIAQKSQPNEMSLEKVKRLIRKTSIEHDRCSAAWLNELAAGTGISYPRDCRCHP